MRAYLVVALVSGLALTSAAAHAAPPRVVSPGSGSGNATAAGCPTFSWASVGGAAGYELVVYRVQENGEPAAGAPVVRRMLPSGATSWSLDGDCLRAGDRYAWAVRVTDGAGRAGEWSSPAVFRVRPELTPELVGAVLDALREQGVSVPASMARSDDEKTVTSNAAGGVKTVSGAGAAIRGELADSSGESYGVVGVSHSAAGAGVAAQGAPGAADVVLDGADDGVPDTRLSESYLDRFSNQPTTFDFRNSGLGGIDLTVMGARVHTTANGGAGSQFDADKLDGLESADFSRILALNAGFGLVGGGTTGSVSLAVDPGLLEPSARAPFANALTTEPMSGSGRFPSITIGVDGLPLVVFADIANNGTAVMHCNDVACAGGDETSSMLDTTNVPTATSVTIGTDGLPVAAFIVQGTGQLEVAHCNDAACSTKTVTAFESSLGSGCSIAIGGDGKPLVTYQVGAALHVLHCTAVDCTSNDPIRSIAGPAGATVGAFSSVAIGLDGLAVVSYFDSTNNKLIVAHCPTLDCHVSVGYTGVTTTTARSPGYTSIAIGADGLPVVSYWGVGGVSVGVLQVLHCTTADCSGWANTAIDASGGAFGDVGSWTSIAVGADGLPVISYRDVVAQALKFARCSDVQCSTAQEALTLDDPVSGDSIDLGTGVAIGADGLPILVYFDATAKKLEVAHCASPFCTSYYRRGR